MAETQRFRGPARGVGYRRALILGWSLIAIVRGRASFVQRLNPFVAVFIDLRVANLGRLPRFSSDVRMSLAARPQVSGELPSLTG